MKRLLVTITVYAEERIPEIVKALEEHDIEEIRDCVIEGVK